MSSVVAAAAVDSPDAVDIAIDRACSRIAPNWPLDQLIAVNPLRGWVDQPFEAMAARLQALVGSRLLMPRAWYREQYTAGRIRESDLRVAAVRAGSTLCDEELVAALGASAKDAPRRELVTDSADSVRDTVRHMRWTEFVTHSISQYCAAYFDDGQAEIRPDHAAGLYATWKKQSARDFAPRLLMGLRAFRARIRSLPERPRDLIRQAVVALGIPAVQTESYLTALLLSINGWAAWCAYQAWQAQWEGRADEHVVELLAIRLAWEWVLFDSHVPRVHVAWREAMARWPLCDKQAHVALAMDRLFQDALEIAYQDEVAAGLVTDHPPTKGEGTADVQTVFCIDVRSEIFRRALEASSDRVETLGFAGFFGLPVDYRPLAAASTRPQLPGLFKPRFRVTDTGGETNLASRRARRLQLAEVWKRFRSSPASAFSFVEAGGLLYAGKLFADSLGWTARVQPERAGLASAEHRHLKPRLVGRIDGSALSDAERIDLAAGVLGAMSLSAGFARLLVLIGHGCATTNNPLAGALECGACGGHTGEVNARATAALLNDPVVRNGLAQRGIVIPATTHVMAGLHNTTTDEVVLFDLDELPDSHRDDVARLTEWLEQAGQRSRAERARKLGLAHVPDQAIHAAMARRARDWSQVRPEWGLVNCAAFVVAPRERTRHLNLAGRAFLHEYRWEADPSLSVLNLILTAPMVVTHWINLQYYASTVDNHRFGSGNKLLHNVVGGHIGVFEGNGGDLRIGLPMQSLHDGERWMHEPLRLSVFVEAPEAAIDTVLGRNPEIARLVDNGWLHLFRLDAASRCVWRRSRSGGWAMHRSAQP